MNVLFYTLRWNKLASIYNMSESLQGASPIHMYDNDVLLLGINVVRQKTVSETQQKES